MTDEKTVKSVNESDWRNVFEMLMGDIVDNTISQSKRKFLEKLNEWRYKDHNPEEDCQCQKCQYYREIVAMVE